MYQSHAVPLALALCLLCWPAAARAQGCYISAHGDYICDNYNAPSAQNAPPQRPVYNEKREQEAEREIKNRLNPPVPPLPEADFTVPPCTGSVPGTSYHASPNGSGSACTAASPCSLEAAMKKAKNGDEVMLKDGVYTANRTGEFWPKSNGVTIRAENTHKAVLRSNKGLIMKVEKDNVTIRGLRIDGAGRETTLTIGKDGGISNIVVENNILENSIRSGIGVGGASGSRNVVIRHNLIQNTGQTLHGEGIYVATSHTDKITGTTSVDIYGNHIRNFTLNGIDLKPGTANTRVHHNILENQVPAIPAYRPRSRLADRGNEGTIQVKGYNVSVHDNIIRDIVDAGVGVFSASEDGGNRIFGNVAMNVRDASRIINLPSQRFGGGAAEISGNTFCGMPNSKAASGKMIRVTNNAGLSGGAPMSACQSEEARILAEMKSLPRCQ